MDNYMMIDLETLSTSPNCVVLSAAFIVFNMDGEVQTEYYQEFDVLGQLEKGREVSSSTQKWWLNTNPKEHQRLLRDGTGNVSLLPTCIEAASKNYDVKKIITRGTMDVPILESLGMKKRPYWEILCMRVLDIFGKVEGDTPHNALEDCRRQVGQILSLQEKLNGNV